MIGPPTESGPTARRSGRDRSVRKGRGQRDRSVRQAASAPSQPSRPDRPTVRMLGFASASHQPVGVVLGSMVMTASRHARQATTGPARTTMDEVERRSMIRRASCRGRVSQRPIAVPASSSLRLSHQSNRAISVGADQPATTDPANWSGPTAGSVTRRTRSPARQLRHSPRNSSRPVCLPTGPDPSAPEPPCIGRGFRPKCAAFH